MPTYSYKARGKQGEIITAVVEADSEMAVASSLRSMGYSVISIEEKAQAKGKIFTFFQGLRAPRQYELIFFARQLALLLKTGITIVTALSSIAEQTKDKTFKEAINAISRDIQSGISFSQALSRHPDIFSEVFVSMVKTGEVAGILDEVLERIAQINEREFEIKTRIKSAMTYPVILVIVALIIVNFLLINIIPKFVVIFEAYEARLPLATQILLAVSFIARKFWLAGLLGMAVFISWLKVYIKSEKGGYNFDFYLLRLPFFGPLYLKVIVARLCRTLGAMTKSGVPLLEALYVSGKTVRNVAVRRVIENVHSSISQGQLLSQPLRASGIFPSTVIQMIALGEQSGKLDQMLTEVANFYDQDVDYTIKNITTALEPVLLLGMGLMVAFIALSVLLPIFNLIKVFRH